MDKAYWEAKLAKIQQKVQTLFSTHLDNSLKFAKDHADLQSEAQEVQAMIAEKSKEVKPDENV